MKPRHRQADRRHAAPAAFRRLCVETFATPQPVPVSSQPPSGGCVLKLKYGRHGRSAFTPAAFRRLCVETNGRVKSDGKYKPAAFRRLCVETLLHLAARLPVSQPPSGGCVLKRFVFRCCYYIVAPAAFRRLCVETKPIITADGKPMIQPPSGGCVLKLILILTILKLFKPAAFRRLCVETTEKRIV